MIVVYWAYQRLPRTVPVFDFKAQEDFRRAGIDHTFALNEFVNADLDIEGPCSTKSMSPQFGLKMRAFSYAVSGYFFNVEIGRYCSIGEAIQVGRHSHPLHYFSTSPFFYQDPAAVLGGHASKNILGNFDWINSFQRVSSPTVLKKTRILNDVYIGHGAFIMPGVTIGNGAVIGACSVVTKDVPDYAVVAGSPAKVLKMRFSDEIITMLLACSWWDFSPLQLVGASCDDMHSFILHVESLRQSGVKPFNGPLVRLS